MARPFSHYLPSSEPGREQASNNTVPPHHFLGDSIAPTAREQIVARSYVPESSESFFFQDSSLPADPTSAPSHPHTTWTQHQAYQGAARLHAAPPTKEHGYSHEFSIASRQLDRQVPNLASTHSPASYDWQAASTGLRTTYNTVGPPSEDLGEPAFVNFHLPLIPRLSQPLQITAYDNFGQNASSELPSSQRSSSILSSSTRYGRDTPLSSRASSALSNPTTVASVGSSSSMSDKTYNQMRCLECNGKIFKRPGTWAKHQKDVHAKRHHGERLYGCGYLSLEPDYINQACGQIMHGRKSYLQHMRDHTNETKGEPGEWSSTRQVHALLHQPFIRKRWKDVEDQAGRTPIWPEETDEIKRLIQKLETCDWKISQRGASSCDDDIAALINQAETLAVWHQDGSPYLELSPFATQTQVRETSDSLSSPAFPTSQRTIISGNEDHYITVEELLDSQNILAISPQDITRSTSESENTLAFNDPFYSGIEALNQRLSSVSIKEMSLAKESDPSENRECHSNIMQIQNSHEFDWLELGEVQQSVDQSIVEGCLQSPHTKECSSETQQWPPPLNQLDVIGAVARPASQETLFSSSSRKRKASRELSEENKITGPKQLRPPKASGFEVRTPSQNIDLERRSTDQINCRFPVGVRGSNLSARSRGTSLAVLYEEPASDGNVGSSPQNNFVIYPDEESWDEDDSDLFRNTAS